MVLPFGFYGVTLQTNRRGVKFGIAVMAVLVWMVSAPVCPARGQGPPSTAYVCPMHPDVVSRIPGTCPRCRTTLVPADPFDAREFLVDVAVQPPVLRPGVPARLRLTVREPATRAVVRDFVEVHEKRYHLFVIFETNAANAGRWIGAWLPWQPETAPPAPRGFRLPRRARFTVELHYRGADQEVTDESSIDVYYSREAAQAVDELLVEGSAPARLARNATVWAIVPSAGEAATSLELTARRPDGSIDVLLWIPQLRREWPQALMLDNPLALPAGTALSLVTHPPNASGRARLSLLR